MFEYFDTNMKLQFLHNVLLYVCFVCVHCILYTDSSFQKKIFFVFHSMTIIS